MAHFVGIKASVAGWSTGTPIQDTDLWQLDSNLVKAINGDDGGAWSPTGAINIGGSYGLVMSAPLVVNSAVLTLSGTASISAASATYTLGAGTFNGLAQFNLGLYVADGVVDFGGQSQTTVSGSWTFVYGFTSTGDTIIGASSGTNTLVVMATETHDGTEYHNGQEEHGGAVFFNGPTLFARGALLSHFESVSSAADLVRSVSSPDVMIVSMTVGGNAIRMSATTGSSTGGAKKTIRCALGSAYGFQVIDTYSGQQIANLSAGGDVTIICDSNRWY